MKKTPKTYFIADVHLVPDQHEKNNLVISFLNHVLSQNGNLYILGDFFDFWANNRSLMNAYRQVFHKLQELTERGLTVGFLIGNRDFLMRPRLLKRYGIIYLGEETRITLDDKKLLLAHGHTLCLSDTKFLAYKKTMWPRFRMLDYILPGLIENWIAEKFILKSKDVISKQDCKNFNFTLPLIENHFKEGIDAVICGHAHRRESFKNNSHCFFSLAPWEKNNGPYLLYEDRQFTEHVFESRLG